MSRYNIHIEYIRGKDNVMVPSIFLLTNTSLSSTNDDGNAIDEGLCSNLQLSASGKDRRVCDEIIK